MPIFRDLDGNFYMLASSDLEGRRIEPKDLQKKLTQEQVTGTEVPVCEHPQPASPMDLAGKAAHITLNQFFAPVYQQQPLQEYNPDGPEAYYNIPQNWGCPK